MLGFIQRTAKSLMMLFYNLTRRPAAWSELRGSPHLPGGGSLARNNIV